MSQSLLRRVQRLNKSLDHLLDTLKPYPDAVLNKAPAPGKWSAVQTMHHLMLSEKLSLQYCKKKLSFKPQLKTAGILSSLREAAVRYYLQSPLKFKAPKGLGTAYLPPDDSLKNIASQWRAQRQELELFIKSLPEEYLHKQVYKHPLVGRLSFEGMLSFFQAHFAHHHKQIINAANS